MTGTSEMAEDDRTASGADARDYVLDEQVGFLLRQAVQRHIAIFESRMGGDLTPTQWATLAKLAEIGSSSQNRLGRYTAMDVATIKGVVDRLKQRGLVATEPDPTDARRRVVTLTPDGEALYEARIANAHAATAETLVSLHPAERRTLLRLLTKML